MYLCYCDICKMLIKDGDKKYILGLNMIQRQEEDVSMTDERGGNGIEYLKDIMERMDNRSKNAKLYEICYKCQRVFENFVDLRIERVKKISKLLELNLSLDYMYLLSE